MITVMTGAAFNRGESKQDYATPRPFLDAFERRFGRIVVDLAAHEGHHVVDRYFTPEDDSLSVNWGALPLGPDEWLWLNPPFARIAPWARKSAESGARVALLVPASVGSNWWRDYVHRLALVFFISGRIPFDGKNGFPKDCALCLYGQEHMGGYAADYFDWRGKDG